MTPPGSIHDLSARLWRGILPERRRQFVALLILMCVGSLTEAISIGAVLPFLGALVNPERILQYPAFQPLHQLLGIVSPGDVILPLTLMFCAVSVAAGVIRIMLLRWSLSYAFGLGAELSADLYRRSLHQPYAVHLARNSSEIINGIAVKASEVIFYVIAPATTLFSSVFMAIAIILTLGFIVPTSVLSIFAVFGLLYAVIMNSVKRHLKSNSEMIARESTYTIRHLQEGLGGIRDILLDGRQDVFVATFSKSDRAMRHAQRDNQFMSMTPRFAMESLGMALIALVALYLSQGQTGMVGVLPMLAALALGLQRLLPTLQQIFHAWSTIHGAESSLREVLNLLEQPVAAPALQVPPLQFDSEIRVRDLGFRYGPDAPWILSNLDLVIPKGARIGFVGHTGSGKSTLLDILMGLLHPTLGELMVDGVAITEENVNGWRQHVAHVPQTIFLTDGSVRSNIAFGLASDQIDDVAVRRAANLAQIGSVIEGWAEGYDTKVGERGVQLSGGQRQRIGIARALYKKADVLIFDEATSALDSETEDAVMRAIESMDEHITILIIAHRLSTLKNCDRIIELGHAPTVHSLTLST